MATGGESLKKGQLWKWALKNWQELHHCYQEEEVLSGLNKDSGKKAVASGEHLPQLSQEERTGSKNEKKVWEQF